MNRKESGIPLCSSVVVISGCSAQGLAAGTHSRVGWEAGSCFSVTTTHAVKRRLVSEGSILP